MRRLTRKVAEQRPEAGFTLVELLIVVTILPLIVGAITAGFITTLNNRDTTTARLMDSHDAQITSTYFVRDVKSAQYVATSGTTVCGTASYLVGLSWSAANSSGTVITYYVAYTLDAAHSTVNRISCQSGGNKVLPVSHDAGTATATVTCTDGTTSCAASGLIAAAPQKKNDVGVDHITLAIHEPTSNFDFSVTASPQGAVAKAANQGGGTSLAPPLLMENNPTINQSGNCHTTVNGVAAFNTTSNNVLNQSGNAALNADEIYSQATSFQGGGSTPKVVGPPLADPYATLTPPVQGDPDVTYVSGTFYPSGQLNGIYILNNGLALSGNTSFTTGSKGVLLYVLHGGVDLSGNSGVTLAPPYAKYAPVSIWMAPGNSSGLNLSGNSGVTSIGGTVYAPNSTVNISGNGGVTAGGMVASSLNCSGNGGPTVGPTGTSTTLTASPASPSADGQALHLTATVQQSPDGTVDSGSVAFQVVDKNGSTTADCASAASVNSSGVATCDTGPLAKALSPYQITALYQGNATYDSSTSNTVTQRVLMSTSTSLSATPNLTSGNAATITATVTAPDGSTPTGTVTFAGVTCSGGNTKTLVAATATCTSGALLASQSPYAVTGTYAESGSPSTWLGSSGQVSIPVSPAATTTTVVSSKPTSKPSAQVVFTATVSPTPNGGSVAWAITAHSGSNPSCSSTTALSSGVATCTVNGGTFTIAGSPYTVKATYSGNTDYNGSNGSTTQNVANIGSATAFVSLTHGTGSSLHKYTDHVKVTGSDGGIPTGQVFFYLCANATTGCTATTPGAVKTTGTLDGTGAAASPASSALTAGKRYCFGAVYQGDTDYLSSADTTTDQCFTG
ncbi:MAG TPA: prepilin-type N-terminal cleavage/methylation domain-containing protein [Mycobacteriales bacterium]|nr:prepilin-type N-terminal cleavage/methylation domain-containing protein [Mycobacteriales bacterium]